MKDTDQSLNEEEKSDDKTHYEEVVHPNENYDNLADN